MADAEAPGLNPPHQALTEVGWPAPVRRSVSLMVSRGNDATELEALLDFCRQFVLDDGFLSSVLRAFAFSQEGLVWFPELLDDEEVWFAGDVHGDRLALEAALTVFQECASKTAKLVFLGDLFDRGPDQVWVVCQVIRCIVETPQRFAWIAGNHDAALHRSQDGGEITSAVRPAELAPWLNARRAIPEVGRFTDFVVSLVSQLPRALFFDGLLAAHGGFPLADLMAHVKTRQDLSTESCLDDFMWTRQALTDKREPQRHGAFGAQDVGRFIDAASRLGLALRSVVRGHDHLSASEDRWERPGRVRRASFEGKVLTINTMSYARPDELWSRPHEPRNPVLCRWTKNEQLPTPVVLELERMALDNYGAPPLPTEIQHPLRPRQNGE